MFLSKKSVETLIDLVKTKLSCASAKGYARTEEGGVAVYVALVTVALIGFGALVVDLGRLFTLQTELQNAADVAALAGAAELDGETDSITRARAAATTALVTASSPTGLLNFQTFASGGAGVTFDPIADIKFLSVLPRVGDASGCTKLVDDDCPVTAVHVTADPRNAIYIEVTAAARNINYLLAPVLALRIGGDGQGQTSGQAAAVAVAGFTLAACKFPPLMICNPAEANGDVGAGFTPVPGQLIQLKAGGNDFWGPGNFGLLQPADGNMGAKWTTQQLASAAPKGCFSTTVDTRPGTVAPVANGINVRFDMYDLPYFHGNEKNNSEFRPAPVVTKGKFYASGPKICDYNNTNTDIDPTDPDGPDCPLGAVPPVGVPFPIHACFATDTCAADEPTWIHPRFQPPADANQAAQEIFWADYWSINHAGNDFNVLYSMIDADGDQIVSRLEMYNWEVSAPDIPLGDVDGDGTPGELGAVTGTSGGDEGKSTATGENGSPMKYGGAEPPEASRRMMPVAVINCIADGPINGASTNVPVVAFAKMFLSHPAEDEDDKAIYAEMVGVLKPGVDREILHDIIQLYR